MELRGVWEERLTVGVELKGAKWMGAIRERILKPDRSFEESRMTRILVLRARIAAGNYRVSAAELAEAIMRERLG